MKTISKKQLILTLLKNDLINARLVYGLDALGLDAGEYLSGLDNTVLRLMGYTEAQCTDAVYATYQDLLARITHVNIIECAAATEGLAVEMYTRLKKLRRTGR